MGICCMHNIIEFFNTDVYADYVKHEVEKVIFGSMLWK